MHALLVYMCCLMYVLFDVCAADPCVHVLFHVLLGVCVCAVDLCTSAVRCVCAVDPCVHTLLDVCAVCVPLIHVYLCRLMCMCC